MSMEKRLERVEKWLDKAEYRLLQLEHRFEMENYALTGLRWVVSVAAGTAIIIAVERLFN